MEAQAVVFTGPREVVFRPVSVPEPGPRDVTVACTHSWISNGTEGSFLRGERINGETPWHPGAPMPFPLVPGYQSVGRVVAVGAEVTDLAPGQAVFASMGRVEGMYEPAGGHISPKVADRTQVWPLPEGVDPEAFSGLVLTQVGYNCGTRPPVDAGTEAVVIGDGLVGQWSAQTLAQRGARVVMVGKHGDRLARFATGGRRQALRLGEAPLDTCVKSLFPSGIDVLIDTVGSVETVRALLPSMSHDGHVVSAGFYGTAGTLDLQILRFGELTLHSPSGWTGDRMDATLAWVAAGKLDTLGLITHRFPVAEAARAWEYVLDKREGALGVVLVWPG